MMIKNVLDDHSKKNINLKKIKYIIETIRMNIMKIRISLETK